jgi:hypothetical protein
MPIPKQSASILTEKEKETHLMYCISRPLRIPWINWNTTPKPTITITPRKLTQHQRPIPALLTLHILMSPQRHPLPQTRHNKRISHSQQRQILIERQILDVQENDRLIC